jgi:hypothetical protein
MEQNLNKVTWQAYEHPPQERSVDWFWGAGLIIVVGAILAIIFSNFLFAIIIVLGGGTLIHYQRRGPELMEFELNEQGVRAGKTFYPYENLDSFWVADKQAKTKLLLESKRTIMPLIDLPLDGADLVAVKTFLARHLKQEKHEESVINLLADWLGF